MFKRILNLILISFKLKKNPIIQNKLKLPADTEFTPNLFMQIKLYKV